MNIPSIESLYATIEQQQRVIKQANEDIAKLESKLEKYQNLEPVGYFEQEYVGGPVLFYQVNYKAEGSVPLYALEK